MRSRTIEEDSKIEVYGKGEERGLKNLRRLKKKEDEERGMG